MVDIGRTAMLGTGADAGKIIARVSGSDYIVNLPKQHDMEAYAEYIMWSIAMWLSGEYEDARLATYKGKLACLVRKVPKTSLAVPYKDIAGVGSGAGYTLNAVMSNIENSLGLDEASIESTKLSFWDMFILDAISGNSKRDGNSWGSSGMERGTEQE